MDKPLISLCMIVKNEEECLGRCLESVRGAVDRTIVLDTGSTDRTREIAAAAGADVFTHAWKEDFAEARNAALEKASGEWVLMLDADEELDGASRTCLRETVTVCSADALRVRLRNILPAGDLCSFDESRLTRIFRNRPAYRYEGTIHEQIRPSIEKAGGRIADARITVVHHGYARTTAQGGQSRTERNLRLLKSALQKNSADAYLHYQAGITCKSLGRSTEAVVHLSRMLELDTRGLDPEVLDMAQMKLAQLALAANDLDGAIRSARAGLAVNPANVVSLYVVALASMFKKDVQTAYDHFVRVRAAPDSPITNTRDLDQMIAYCRKVLGIDA